MKKGIRRFCLVIMIILVGTCLSGCAGNPAQGRVYWLNYKPEIDGTLQKLARRYTAETGVEVKGITAAAGACLYGRTEHAA